MTMQLFVGRDDPMIATPIQGEVDGVPKRLHLATPHGPVGQRTDRVHCAGNPPSRLGAADALGGPTLNISPRKSDEQGVNGQDDDQNRFIDGLTHGSIMPGAGEYHASLYDRQRREDRPRHRRGSKPG